MSKVHLWLEVQDQMGKTIKRFSKDVESKHTPNSDMVFTGEGYTLKSRNVYFDVDDGSVSVRFVECPNKDELEGWDFLASEGWKEDDYNSVLKVLEEV